MDMRAWLRFVNTLDCTMEIIGAREPQRSSPPLNKSGARGTLFARACLEGQEPNGHKNPPCAATHRKASHGGEFS